MIIEAVVQRCSVKRCSKGVLRNFAKFTGKRLCQSLFFNKVAGLRPKSCNFIKNETMAQVFSYEFFLLQNTSYGCFWCLDLYLYRKIQQTHQNVSPVLRKNALWFDRNLFEHLYFHLLYYIQFVLLCFYNLLQYFICKTNSFVINESTHLTNKELRYIAFQNQKNPFTFNLPSLWNTL